MNKVRKIRRVVLQSSHNELSSEQHTLIYIKSQAAEQFINTELELYFENKVFNKK